MSLSRVDIAEYTGSLVFRVDDNYDIATLIKFSLKKVGLSAVSFTDPLAALEEFRSHAADYDILISDVRMPTMDGYQLAWLVKKIKPEVKVVPASAFEYDSIYFSKDLSLENITARFIEKPISIAELRKVVHTLMDNNNKPLQYQSTIDPLQ
jgi:CheY-like chemotaxis protein